MTTEISRDLTLRVAEAFSKDVGRGLARIDPEDMKVLGTEVGDIDEKSLIMLMVGLTGADVSYICKEAAMLAIEEYIENEGDIGKPDFKIHQKHFEEAINTYKKMHEIPKTES